MSLIVARKENSRITVVSETKLTNTQDLLIRSDKLLEFGTIKTIIIHKELCVSFAGDMQVSKLGELFSSIQNESDTHKIIEHLIEFNRDSNFRTDFILCTGKPNPCIYLIAEGNCSSQENAWIGDKSAFSLFQEGVIRPNSELFTNTINPKLLGNHDVTISGTSKISIHMESNSTNLNSLSSAMDYVLENGNNQSVGGLKVVVEYNEGFSYCFYSYVYPASKIHLGFGPHFIGHGNAVDGSYTLISFGSSIDFKTIVFHIKQANLGVVFRRTDSSVFLPEFISDDEVGLLDLVVKNNRWATNYLTSQSPSDSYRNKYNDCIKHKDYSMGIKYLDKLIEVVSSKEKAEIYFLKGQLCFQINNPIEAIINFQKAIQTDSGFSSKVSNSISTMFKYKND